MTGRFAITCALVLLFANRLAAAEYIPPAPEHDFNDFAGIIQPATARQFDDELVQFAKTGGVRVVIAIFPVMQSRADVETYAKSVADAWRSADQTKRKTIVLLVFMKDHLMSIQTDPSLEKSVPDSLCQDIIDHEMLPHFTKEDYNGGITAAINALTAALHGEYQPAPRPSASAASN
jgi:uncharacterized protein